MTDPVREAMARKLLAMPDDPAADLPIGALRDEHREAVRVLELHVRSLDAMSQPLGQAVTQYTADENKAQAAAIRKTIDYLAALSHPPAAAETVAPADLRRSLWNAAVEACALLVQPIPHIEEERTCGEVAAAIRGLLLVAPSPQPTQQADEAMREELERIVLIQQAYCEHHIKVPSIVYELANIASAALTQGQQEKKE